MVEQLEFQKLNILPPTRVAVLYLIEDAETDPKLWIALRNSGRAAGRYMVPGGKLKPRESPMRGIRRETYEETGLRIEFDYLIQAGEPRVMVTDGNIFRFHSYFAFRNEACFDQFPQRTEPLKNEEWHPVRITQAISLLTNGLLHPAIFRGWWLEILEETLELARELPLKQVALARSDIAR